MRRLLRSHSGQVPRLSEIVAKCPSEIIAFFENFSRARNHLSLTAEIDVLNAVAEEEYKNCGPERPTVLVKWFEVFRNIYVLHCLGRLDCPNAIKKNPNNFSTFARTFEPLAFLPDFWFAADRNVAAADLRGRAHGLRLTFERYFYAREGGGAWGAMDWEMNRFLQRRIYEALKSDEAGALRRLAALALAARAVVAGELGLYVEERDDVTLPLSGISNVWNDPSKKNALLKYYHYDRFTQLSYAREHEFAMDPNVPGTHVRFERQWMALAVISDVIVKESDAHSTQAAASRVMLESVAQCMRKIKDKLLKQGDAHPRVRHAAETLYDLVVFHPDDFSKLSELDLLKKIGVTEKPMPATYYLGKCGFASAEDFWDKMRPIFAELQAAIDSNRDRVVAKYTEAQRRGGYKDAASSLVFVQDRISKGALSELPGEVGRNGIRDALKRLMLDGSITLQYATLDAVLTGGDKPLDRCVQVWSEERRAVRELPARIPFVATETEGFRKWILVYLTELSEQCAEEANRRRAEEKALWEQQGHVASSQKRNRFPKVCPINYRRIDFAEVIAKADELWNYYFTEDDVCLKRWIVSIDRALKIMASPDVQEYQVAHITKSFSRGYAPDQRFRICQRLEAEKARFVREGCWPRDIESLKEDLQRIPSLTIDDLLSGEARILIMVAVLARLMVASALLRPELWEVGGDLFALYTHILIASNHDFDLPFPWHLEVTSGSYLRTGRSHSRQGNVMDDFVEGDFHYESERTVFIVFVAHYLAQQYNADAILRVISATPGMRKFFAKDDGLAEQRINFLKAYFS